ncbi:unnamed protein product [Cuscuta campestris]|uniref:Uncharacterized protein n=1 Tax=Cuscuta campestris TaxID=132261 RepID=A0A484LVI4_9ASTE|nr:unnamed protein product [Cuscuta campestris]
MKKAIQGVHEIIELTTRKETTESEVMQSLEAVRKEFNSSKTKIKAYVQLLHSVEASTSKHIRSSDSEDCDSP